MLLKVMMIFCVSHMSVCSVRMLRLYELNAKLCSVVEGLLPPERLTYRAGIKSFI